MTLSVKNLHLPGPRPDRAGPEFIDGMLWLDSGGLRLFDWDDESFVLIADPQACAALRAALPAPGEYVGGALMQAWVRYGPGRPELHDIYWVQFFEPDREPAQRWGQLVKVRPVPPQYDYER